MRIIFFGSAHFAVPALEALIESKHELACVVTQPDKQKGRHLQVTGTDVKSTAVLAKLKIFQPENINSQESVKFLKGLDADLFVIVAYGQIFSQEVLDIPKIMPINIHASLLPRYRGAAPINWAIINAEKKAGVSIMYVSLKMDSGPVILQKETKIEEKDTAVSLEEKLRYLGAELLIDALKIIDSRNYRLLEQDEDKVIIAPKLKKEDGLIDWAAPAVNIHNQVRGVLPWPGAFTGYRGKILKIFRTEVLPLFSIHKPVPGEVVRADKRGLVVACARGFLEIKELQLEAGKRMSAQNFIIGHKLIAGEVLGKTIQ
ncbi:MAG: methionyl-tRNA formyltransferase [Candidatus Omnitrophica bacterium]|nr:methionyl-tRNA formyltransferase [Candidatus Omnitrophota bacterium]MBU4303639.1 methionyl-tRNA formyltransferase [Candidatus Omnitrophota bacterium]MBU4418566.1 methionyl-tRNA formyltransferase [Candidatus Omnitrophota bacterium]MBU4467233.1 methionyl-tRNA formyltransferase [Candidatus Omnitrophota bacterium]MCG2707633.1 methionyl-tRNA formyltransferase [Candidatus Omnitrophota bacterium]